MQVELTGFDGRWDVGIMEREHDYKFRGLSAWKCGTTFRAGDSAIGRVGLGEDQRSKPDSSGLI